MDYYFDLMTYELEMYNQTKDKSYFEKALKSKAAIIGTITINGISSFIVFLLFRCVS